jgi:hypothetical protein
MARRTRANDDAPFIPPVRATPTGFVLHFDADDRAFLVRLLGELRALLAGEGDQPLLARLFPPAFPDDPEKEEEYQRLMRDELVASRTAAIDAAVAVLDADRDHLDADGDQTLSEAQLLAFLQSVNAVRIVLGTMLGIADDDDAEAAEEGDSPNHHLYGYLGWVVEWTVRALSTHPR